MKYYLAFDSYVLSLCDRLIEFLWNKWGYKKSESLMFIQLLWLGSDFIYAVHSGWILATIAGLIFSLVLIQPFFHVEKSRHLQAMIRVHGSVMVFRALSILMTLLFLSFTPTHDAVFYRLGTLAWPAYMWLSDALPPEGPRKKKKKKEKRVKAWARNPGDLVWVPVKASWRMGEMT